MTLLMRGVALHHWSSTVGASHGQAYSMWRYEDYASRGVQELCELGHVQALERELRHYVSVVLRLNVSLVMFYHFKCRI